MQYKEVVCFESVCSFAPAAFVSFPRIHVRISLYDSGARDGLSN